MEKRVPNSEQKLIRLEEQEAEQPTEKGILELFERDEDAALVRDADAEPSS
jgi:hypothetical protein